MSQVLTKTVTAYKYDELSDSAKEKALEKMYDINVDHDWWEFIYEDAKTIGLKITGFDVACASYCNGDFLASAEETAHKIEKEHGENCETFKTAKEYLKIRDEIIETAPKDENGDFESEYEIDQALDSADKEFLRSLLEDYRIILQKDYEYFTSREAIEETIRANEYDFTKEGKFPAL